jgi:phosphate-selective porin
MTYKKRTLFSNTQNFITEEKLKFLRGVLESLGINIRDWDINAEYDVDLEIFINQKLKKNDVAVEENELKYVVAAQNKVYRWEVIRKNLVIDEIKNKMFVEFEIKTTLPGSE